MGKDRAAKKNGSRFLDLKSSIVERLQNIHRLQKEHADCESGGTIFGGVDKKQVIAAQSEIREEIRQVTDEWRELDVLYKAETRKRRSKFTPEELEAHQTLVLSLQAEIEKVKEIQTRGYAFVERRSEAEGYLKFQAPVPENESEGNKWTGGPTGTAITDDQRRQIQTLQDRDQEFDRELDEIGDGILELREIAQMQGDEVRRQNVMLENVGKKLDKNHEHIVNINHKMIKTLAQVRGADKLCVDLMCIVLMVGFGVVFYTIAKGSSG